MWDFLAIARLGAEDFWHIEDRVGLPCSKLSPPFCSPRPAVTSPFALTSSGTTALKATSATGETKLTTLTREFWLQWLCGHICLVEDVYLYKDGIAGGMCCKQPDYLKNFLSLPLARVESVVYSKRYTTGFPSMTMWNKQEGELKMWFGPCLNRLYKLGFFHMHYIYISYKCKLNCQWWIIAALISFPAFFACQAQHRLSGAACRHSVLTDNVSCSFRALKVKIGSQTTVEKK